eukprot:gene3922-4291_t
MSVEIQKRVKDDAEDVQAFVEKLGAWETEIKKKDAKLRATPSEAQSLPPIRNALNKEAHTKEQAAKC